MIRRLTNLHAERQFDRERGAEAQSRALRRHGAAMHLDDVSHDCEAETQATMHPCSGAVSLPEPIENMTEELRLDALPAVCHADSHSALLHLDSNVNTAARRRKL